MSTVTTPVQNEILVSIDPATRNLGWAVFIIDHTSKFAQLANSGCFRVRGLDEETQEDSGKYNWIHHLDTQVNLVVDQLIIGQIIRKADQVFLRSKSVLKALPGCPPFDPADLPQTYTLRALIELPSVYSAGPQGQGPASSRAQAASNSGAIMKLASCVFSLREAIRSRIPDRVDFSILNANETTLRVTRKSLSATPKAPPMTQNGALLRTPHGLASLPVLTGRPEVTLYPVSVWKGTTPKEITQKRMTRYWGWDPNAKGSSHDEADAIGIGDYHIRRVLQYRCPVIA